MQPFSRVESSSAIQHVTRAGGSMGQYGESWWYGFAEPWNGASWSVVRTPNPAGSYDSPLSAVSCTGPARCVAVGANFTGNNQGRTLAEVFE